MAFQFIILNPTQHFYKPLFVFVGFHKYWSFTVNFKSSSFFFSKASINISSIYMTNSLTFRSSSWTGCQKSVVSDATHHASLFLNSKKLNFLLRIYTTPRSFVALFCDVKLFLPPEVKTNKVGNRDDIWIINATWYNIWKVGLFPSWRFSYK